MTLETICKGMLTLLVSFNTFLLLTYIIFGIGSGSFNYEQWSDGIGAFFIFFGVVNIIGSIVLAAHIIELDTKTIKK